MKAVEMTRRAAARPLLRLPDADARGRQAGQVLAGPVEVGDVGVRLADQDCDVEQASCREVLDLIALLRAGPEAGSGRVKRRIALLYDRLHARIEVEARLANADAVDAVEAEIAAQPVPKRSRHGQDLQLRARRAAVSLLAADLAVSQARLWRDLRIVGQLADLPVATAAATQGALGWNKAAALAEAWAQVPEQLQTRPIEEGLVRLAVDAPAHRVKGQLDSALAPMLPHTEPDTLDERAKKLASLSVEPLGGGMAAMRIVDVAENIAALLTVANAGARTLAHHGMPGTKGQLRAGVLADLAKQALRDQQIASPFATRIDLEGYGGQRVQILVQQRPPLLYTSKTANNCSWELPGIGPITPTQLARLCEYDAYAGIVVLKTLTKRKDKKYAKAAKRVSHRHDPTPTQRAAVLARDGDTCRAPFCTDPSPPDDLHHVDLFANTGTTTVDGLIALHAACHRIIHDAWLTRLEPDGTAHFTDQDATTWTTTAPGLAPENRDDPAA